MQKITWITAHSGAEDTAPNSLDFVRRAIASGCEALEVDVRLRGGELILSHDEPAQDAACASLEQALQLAQQAPSIYVNCDMKQPAAQQVLDLARKSDMSSRLIFTGAVTEEELDMLADTEAQAWLNAENVPGVRGRDDLPALLHALLAHRCRCVNLHWKLVDRALLDALGERNIGVAAWTADTEQEISALLALGVTSITTNHPVLALKLRGQLAK